MIKFFLNKFSKIFLVLFLTILVAELTAKIFVHLGLLDKGLPAWVTLRAHKDFGNWHPKNITLDLEKKNCWTSTVSYNSLGMRKTSENTQQKKNNLKKIALLGDSMIENIEVTDGFDLGSLVQKKLKEYSVHNFSARGTGLADQIEIYKNLIKSNNFDYLFLFLTENDIDNNVNGYTTIHHKRYDVVDNKIIEISKDKEFFDNYNSKFNIIKRDYFLKFKKLDLYKVYLKFIYIFDVKKKETKLINESKKIKKFELSEKKIMIYKKIKNDFLIEMDKNTNLIIFLNARPHIFEPDRSHDYKKEFLVNNFFKETWKDNVNIYDPYLFTKKKLIDLDMYRFPYLSMDCDAHYSPTGADIYSDFIKETFLKTVKN